MIHWFTGTGQTKLDARSDADRAARKVLGDELPEPGEVRYSQNVKHDHCGQATETVLWSAVICYDDGTEDSDDT